jgi:hypothetical protein
LKTIAYLIAISIALTSLTSVSVAAQNKGAAKALGLKAPPAGKKKKSRAKVKAKKVVPKAAPMVVEIGYPSITVAYNAIKERSDVAVKPNAKPFGWQDRSGPWYVVKDGPNIEWAFTEGGHYAHPSVVKRMIDVGSADHVYVDTAFRCGAPNSADCDKLQTEFKEVKTLITKVYEKKFIKHAGATAVWNGVDSLE